MQRTCTPYCSTRATTTARLRASVGEISDALREVFGEHVETLTI